MTSFWTGTRVRLRGIEPDDWTAFMRFAADEDRLGDLLHPPRSGEGYPVCAKEQAAAKPDGSASSWQSKPPTRGRLRDHVSSPVVTTTSS